MQKALLRCAAAEFLTDSGYPIRPNHLAKLASIGGGPKFRKFGNRPIYDPDDLLAWAEERAGEKVSSTSEYQSKVA